MPVKRARLSDFRRTTNGIIAVALLLFFIIILVILAGYPVAFTLAGVSLLFAVICASLGLFDINILHVLPNRIYSILTNSTLIAIPMFVFMGVTLQKTKLAEELLLAGADLMHRLRSGLGISIVLVGALLAASTGIVGATVTTMGLLSVPAMLKRRYHPNFACGTVCAAGTLGQIIPPSIMLIMLGDVISSSYQQAHYKQGSFASDSVSVSDLFAGALLPGLLLVALYVAYIFIAGFVKPQWMPPYTADVAQKRTQPKAKHQAYTLFLPLVLIFVVLGSILSGAASPTEAASVGAIGAVLLAVLRGEFSIAKLREISRETVKISCMVFMILIGATVFTLVFRGLEGDILIHEMLIALPGDLLVTMIVVMLAMFILGFVLDFIEIMFVVVPVVAPTLIIMGADPIWLAIMIAVNLQTSFMTPPFGFSLFYLRGVVTKKIRTKQIYRGVMPFVGLQLLALLMLALWPELATWLPKVLLN